MRRWSRHGEDYFLDLGYGYEGVVTLDYFSLRYAKMRRWYTIMNGEKISMRNTLWGAASALLRALEGR